MLFNESIRGNAHTMTTLTPFVEHAFDANELLKTHPPRVTDVNKSIVFRLGLENHHSKEPKLHYSCWSQVKLPTTVSRLYLDLIHHNEYFSYPESTPECIEWHLNFAHEDLFAFYGGPLFAQDEMQVAEHPLLGCLREALIEEDIYRTTIKNGSATPILVSGVERKCRVDVSRDIAAGRPRGLYGNEFQYASESAILEATTLIEPPTRSNIIAMESPQPDFGFYTRDQIEFILASAITGFSAAVSQSKKIKSDASVSIHTGYWGCGAYGGNRELMPLLQIIAAHCAEVDTLHFHSGGDNSGYFQALNTLDLILPDLESISIEQLINIIFMMRYEWGVSDGN